MGMGLFYVSVLVIFFREWDLWFCCVFGGGFAESGIFVMVFCGELMVSAWFFVVPWLVVFGGLKICHFVNFIFGLVWKFRIWERHT
jgi:hypothetical protein